MLAGVRYLARDKLLGPLTLTVIVLDGAAPCEQRAVEQAAPEATPSPSPTANPPG